MTISALKRPRNGWSKPRIAEKREITSFILLVRKTINYSRKNIILYGCDFEGVVTANGEVKINVSRCKPRKTQIKGEPRDISHKLAIVENKFSSL
jgi:hypothetical protein